MGIVKRNVALAIVLTIVTCGIYGIYWYICLADDVNRAMETPEGTSGGMVFLFTLITCGIYGLYWAYKTGEKLDDLRVKRGLSAGNKAILYLILNFIGLSVVTYALIQSDLNDFADVA